MIRKAIIDSVLQQSNTDQAFENEALATFVEGEITNKLLSLVNEQDIQKMEKLKAEEIFAYLSTRIPNLSEIITEEIKKAKVKFQI